MPPTTQTVSVTELKAKLSEHLRRVKAGETVLITERGRLIGVMKPLSPGVMSDDLAELVEAGLVRPASAPLPADYWERERPEDTEALVRRAIIEEREEGR